MRRVWGTQLRARACGGRAPTGLSEGRRETGGVGDLKLGGSGERKDWEHSQGSLQVGCGQKVGSPHLQSEP